MVVLHLRIVVFENLPGIQGVLPAHRANRRLLGRPLGNAVKAEPMSLQTPKLEPKRSETDIVQFAFRKRAVNNSQ